MKRALIQHAPVWLVFILGLWLVVIRPLGPNLALAPGDLGDARLNNYFFEHFSRWATGSIRDYWNAPFFYPYQKTMAFSDNLLGSAPFYAVFRWTGLGMASAFQAWYILGCVLKYAAAGANRLFRLRPGLVGSHAVKISQKRLSGG